MRAVRSSRKPVSTENVWFAEFRRCKIGKFDPRTEKFTEYAALTQPCTIRRVGVDSAGMVWYGWFNNGKLGKIDPKTGKIVEYAIPMPFSEPYDVWPDREDQMAGGHPAPAAGTPSRRGRRPLS